MKIKKYHGNTMPEVMKQVREELGPDAVILNTKEVQHGGLFGLFTKTKLEVTAALDPEPLSTEESKNNRDRWECIQKNSQPIPTKHSGEPDVLREIQQLKKMMHLKNDFNYDPGFSIVFDYLRDQEVELELAKQLVDHLHNNNFKQEHRSTHHIGVNLQSYIEKRLNDQFVDHQSSNQQVVHFVGPTGVGKTTTLAKVAANSLLQEDKKIAFITTDTYRIAAIDQLKTYAHILNVPLEVAYTKEDYIQAIEKLAEYDVIYVDTAGRNFRKPDYREELRTMLHVNADTKTYLVLSLTAKQKDMIDIFNAFKPLNIQSVIFTKVDETRQYGNILNIALTNDVKIAYLTNGQDVPDDLMIPTASKISQLIMGEFLHE